MPQNEEETQHVTKISKWDWMEKGQVQKKLVIRGSVATIDADVQVEDDEDDAEDEDESHFLNLHEGQKFVSRHRPKWPEPVDSLLCLTANAVGFSTIAVFPSIYYADGKMAFLIPYTIFLVFCVYPVLYLEGLLGQYVQKSGIAVWKIVPLFKGIGYCVALINMFLQVYENVPVVWSMAYLKEAIFHIRRLPWTSCNNSWNTDNCVELLTTFKKTKSNEETTPGEEFFKAYVLEVWEVENRTIVRKYGFHDTIGDINYNLLTYAIAVFIFLLFNVNLGISAGRKTIWMYLCLKYLCMGVLVIRGLFLNGALQALTVALTPEFDRLWDEKVWRDAAIRAFYSLGAGLNVHIMCASFNEYHHDTHTDTVLVILFDTLSSLFATIMIFSFAGHVAKVRQITFEEQMEQAGRGVGFAFQVFPDALAVIPGATVYTFLFFMLIIIAKLDSSIMVCRTISITFLDAFHQLKHDRHSVFEYLFNFGFLGVVFVVGMMCYSKGGIWVYNFVGKFAAGLSLNNSMLLMLIVVPWIWGQKSLCDAVELMTKHRPGLFLRLCWKIITPASLVAVSWIIFLQESINWSCYDDEAAPIEAHYFGCVMTIAPILLVFVILLIEIATFPAGTLHQRMVLLLSPENEHESIRNSQSWGDRFTFTHLFYIAEKKDFSYKNILGCFYRRLSKLRHRRRLVEKIRSQAQLDTISEEDKDLDDEALNLGLSIEHKDGKK